MPYDASPAAGTAGKRDTSHVGAVLRQEFIAPTFLGSFEWIFFQRLRLVSFLSSSPFVSYFSLVMKIPRIDSISNRYDGYRSR